MLCDCVRDILFIGIHTKIVRESARESAVGEPFEN